MIHVIVKRRNGNNTKPVLNLAKKTSPLPETGSHGGNQPPEPPKPKLRITAAADGPPIAAELPAKNRGLAPWSAARGLTDEQNKILDRIIKNAGEGHAQTYGLRLVLAASRDEQAGAWPIGLLAKALGVAGRATESHAVFKVAQGCRVSRFEDMATSALEVVSKKLQP